MPWLFSNEPGARLISDGQPPRHPNTVTPMASKNSCRTDWQSTNCFQFAEDPDCYGENIAEARSRIPERPLGAGLGRSIRSGLEGRRWVEWAVRRAAGIGQKRILTVRKMPAWAHKAENRLIYHIYSRLLDRSACSLSGQTLDASGRRCMCLSCGMGYGASGRGRLPVAPFLSWLPHSRQRSP